MKMNNIEMYSTFNEIKSAVAQRFIRTLKNKILKTYDSFIKNVCFDVLHDIAKKYNNSFHNTIKMKPIDVIFDSFVEYSDDSNKKKSKISSWWSCKNFKV